MPKPSAPAPIAPVVVEPAAPSAPVEPPPLIHVVAAHPHLAQDHVQLTIEAGDELVVRTFPYPNTIIH